MDNLSRMSSSCKDRPYTNSKLMSSYTSHTRCESVSRPAPRCVKKIQKLHTQMISSRKYNSTYKNAAIDVLSKQPTSPYRTSFSSIKGKRQKNSCNSKGKCQSSYNLKDGSVSKQMINSSDMFNSLYVEPVEMIFLMDKDNKQSLRSTQHKKKKTATSSKNQVTTKRQILQSRHPSDLYWKKSQQNLSRIFQRSKSKQTAVIKDVRKMKNEKYRKNSIVLSPTETGSKIILNNSESLINPYNDMLSRTFEILNKYEKKIVKLEDEKTNYQRLYQKSQIECQNLRKSLKKKDKKYNSTQQNTNKKEKQTKGTKDSLKISIQNLKR